LILRGSQVEQRKNVGSQPARAHLVPWEPGAIGDDDVPTCETKQASRSGTSRASSHD
jgi:hypothetical protein